MTKYIENNGFESKKIFFETNSKKDILEYFFAVTAILFITSGVFYIFDK